jgi:Family of unknown function (DUF5681)
MTKDFDQDHIDLPSDAAESGSDRAPERTYEVGYRKPPAATRFPKGRSGNPKGRKKKAPIDDMRLEVDEFFDATVKVVEGGRTRTVSRMEAIVNMYRVQALQADAKAAEQIFRLAQKTGQFTRAKLRSGLILVPPGTPEEQALMRVFHATNDCNREGPSADQACGFLPGNAPEGA